MTATPDSFTLDHGQLIVAVGFQDRLRQSGLDTFAKVMALPATTTVRAVPGRSTIRIALPGLVGYLKRYEPHYLSATRKVLRRLRWPGAADEAGREWRKLHLLRGHGFRTAVPVALGQQRVAGMVRASFLLQQEIPGGVPADEYLPRLPVARRRRLLLEIGKLARRFQEAGFIHKDFYLKHVFVAERGEDWDLYLIDLQRVRGPWRHRQRWYRKDLAALAFSAHKQAGLSRTDLLRLFHGFSGRAPLTAADKRVIRRVWWRAQRLLRRGPRYKRVWNAP